MRVLTIVLLCGMAAAASTSSQERPSEQPKEMTSHKNEAGKGSSTTAKPFRLHNLMVAMKEAMAGSGFVGNNKVVTSKDKAMNTSNVEIDLGDRAAFVADCPTGYFRAFGKCVEEE